MNSIRKADYRILILSIIILIFFSMSCSPDGEFKKTFTKTDIKDGYYYKKTQYLGKIVYGFIQIKNGYFIKDHALYLDLERKHIFRKPYQPENYTFNFTDDNLIVNDPSNSYEIIKRSWFGKKEVISKERFRISYCSGKLCLKNVDIQKVVYIYCGKNDKQL